MTVTQKRPQTHSHTQTRTRAHFFCGSNFFVAAIAAVARFNPTGVDPTIEKRAGAARGAKGGSPNRKTDETATPSTITKAGRGQPRAENGQKEATQTPEMHASARKGRPAKPPADAADARQRGPTTQSKKLHRRARAPAAHRPGRLPAHGRCLRQKNVKNVDT